MAPLQVIALISGGKDSLFSVLHCLACGHEVVALANLHPPLTPSSSTISPSLSQGEDETVEGEDINSYMYQTVGHTLIPLYSSALEIPLYRQEILGGAINKDRDYAFSPPPSSTSTSTASSTSPAQPSENHDEIDETESLIPLLKRVLREHPQANAISTGAILSTYQRTRVESIALRLGLVPLSYLWQYPFLPPYTQSSLLHDMRAVGQDSRIIKVASGGIDESFLGLNVADVRTVMRLGRAVGRFWDGKGDLGGAVLGEGGEFETLAIDGPKRLWKKRIEVEFGAPVLGEGGNAVASWKVARVVEKEDDNASRGAGLQNLRVPHLWDDEFIKARELMTQEFDSEEKPPAPQAPQSFSSSNSRPFPSPPPPIRNAESSTLLTISNLSAPSSYKLGPSDQLSFILTLLADALNSYWVTPEAIVHTTLLLRSISDFAVLNPIYSKLFPSPNPPSRVTVACGDAMPEGVDVMLSAVITKTGVEGRRGLHVQSRSYWAPANIGPYSQAISSRILDPADPSIKEGSNGRAEAVWLAGQIPLVPSTMEPITGPFANQTLLALQHLWRIGRAMEVNSWAAGVAYISNCAHEEAEERVKVAQKAWRSVHQATDPSFGAENGDSEEEKEDVDPWDLRNRVGGNSIDFDRTIRPPLPKYETGASYGAAECMPPCLVVRVDKLPREVDVEWWSVGISKAVLGPFQTSFFGGKEVGGTASVPSAVGVKSIASYFTLELDEELLDGWNEDGDTQRSFLVETLGIRKGWGEGIWDHCTVFAVPDGMEKVLKMVPECAVVVPCKGVWGRGGRELKGALIGRWTQKVGK
ncbi:adenine nucleotide alpha hydrolases-like protein [Delitschia confertaspora ATCC 74209]|uniref:Diphthine--ammonia ligase n=1 Tax=Delitschia confertaspora ATCC 74209 TaxID=1513339 RepID=A0A9P4MRJ9_9PLEO|nr:adenine nucleotide alpha hydrolases-like protein [Delitschia confertaspora ATCC 74209]